MSGRAQGVGGGDQGFELGPCGASFNRGARFADAALD